MKFTHILLSMTFLSSVPFAATTTKVSLSGKVTDASGTGMADVELSLKTLGLSATTNAKGLWSITQTPPSAVLGNGVAMPSISLRNGVVELSLAESGVAKVHVYSPTGQMMRTALDGNLVAGSYNVSLGDVPAGLWIVRVQAGGQSESFRWFGVGSDGVASLYANNAEPSLAKTASVVDSLVVSYDGAVVGALGVTSLTAGALDTIVIAKVIPAIAPSSAGVVVGETPIYILPGTVFKVKYFFDVNYWRPAWLHVGEDSTAGSGTSYSVTLADATDSVYLELASRLQSITFSSIADKTYGAAAFKVYAVSSSGLGVTIASNTKGICTVADSTVTIVGAGTCVLVASQTGNANYNAATSVTQSFAVAKHSQSITFDEIADKTYGDVAFKVHAVASSGLDVTIASNTADVCSVAESTVTIVGVGTCVLVTLQAGNIKYNTATSETRSFVVAKKELTVTGATASDKDYDGTTAATITGATLVGKVGTDNVTLTVGVATFSNANAGAGIAVTVTGSSLSGTATKNYMLTEITGLTATIHKIAATITFTNPGTRSAADSLHFYPLLAEASTNVGTLSFTSSTSSICIVSGDTVSLTGEAGLCTIHASYVNTDNVATQSFRVDGRLVDSRDAQVYRTVKIGTQTWIAQNLNYSGDTISGSRTYTKGWCYGVAGTTVHTDAPSCDTDGRIYNWTDAMDIASSYLTNFWGGSAVNHQGLCPSGWHVPTDAEWDILYVYVDANNGTDDGVGTSLKTNSLWQINNGTDYFGFSAMPAGGRNDRGGWDEQGNYTFFWTASEYSEPYARRRSLSYYSADFEGSPSSKEYGLSLRCVRN